MDLCLLVLL
uniref:Uncharacterized protein n=1 Tax=Arundo donax TaxID=35708 RepID=A0A0A9G4B2_ARUDO